MVFLTLDEEIGGIDGMYAWLDTEHFKTINLGLALDEGLASENDTFTVFYGERESCGEYAVYFNTINAV